MKKKYFIVLFLSFSLCGYAQVGIGTVTPNVHAVLELKAPNNDQGLIVPSLTTAQRTATSFISSLSASDNGLLVFDSQENKFYYWQSNAWQIIVSGAVAGGAIGPAGGDLSGNYPNPQLAPNSVTAAKIADGTITDIKIISVTPSKLLAGGAVTGQVLKWNGSNWTAQADNTGGTGTLTSIATGVGLTGGPITSTGTISIADNGVTSVKIIDNAITTAKIADATITTTDLADGSVTDAKVTSVAPSKLLAGGAVTGQILKWNGSNWTAQADNTGGSGTLTSITTGTGLTGGPVTTTGTISLADNGITTVKIIDNAVTTSKINDNAVTSAKIVDATIAVADLADGSVTDAKITSVAPVKFLAGGAATGQVLKWSGTSWTAQADNSGGSGTVTSIATGAGLTGGPVTTTGTISLADNGVTTVKIIDNAITTTKINDNAITTIKLADNSITGLKIVDGVITNADINTTAAIADTKLATISTAGKVSGNAITSGTIGGTTAINTSGPISFNGILLPNGDAGTSGQVLTSQGSGVASIWTDVTSSLGWNLNGNSGTSPGTGASLGINFIGTTDNHALEFVTNNTVKMRITTKGALEIHNSNASVFIGQDAGVNNTGTGNVGIGTVALANNTSGGFNNATGIYSLNSNTTGSNNTAAGTSSLRYNTTGENNTAIGYSALQDNNNGNDNVAIGLSALLGNKASSNVAVGNYALLFGTTGTNNTAVGFQAGYNVGGSGGSNNTCIGANSDSNPTFSNTTAIGYGAVVDASNKVRIGNSAVTVIQGQVSFSAASDSRLKTDINDLREGLDWISKLRPVSYFLKNQSNPKLNWGFIAQDIEKLVGTENAILTIGGDSERTLGLRYTDFIAPLVKAMQEQQHEIEQQQRKIDTLQQAIDELLMLKQKIAELEASVKKASNKEAQAHLNSN